MVLDQENDLEDLRLTMEKQTKEKHDFVERESQLARTAAVLCQTQLSQEKISSDSPFWKA